jgi:hypothetical protein
MGARILPYRIGIFSLLREILYTLSQMSAEPVAAPYLPTFQGHKAKWQTVLLEEISIVEQLAMAQATVNRADMKLDRFVRRVIRAVNDNTGGATQKQIRAKLLKGKAESKFRAPVLGQQLKDMSDWSSVLAGCGVAALVALAPEAAAHYQLGKDADELRQKAQAQNRTFRDVGMRKQFIDEVNASRKEVDGSLAKLPFQDPTLPQDFNEEFFLSDTPRDEEESIDDVKASIKELESQLDERKALLAKMEQEAAAAAAAEQAQKEQEAQAEELEAQAAELLKKAAELKRKK